jgi:hypothetical protein
VSPPTDDDFRALARSSPWLWSTLRFTVRWSLEAHGVTALRAWLRRPDRLRVETVDGALVQVVHEPRRPAAPEPELRPDGLVARRPPVWQHEVDDPMHQNYFWVSVLDPAEFADGDADDGTDLPGLDLVEIGVVDHGGRPAWEALVRTTPAYEPRCGCCSLLRDRRIDELEWGEAKLDAYPEAYRVRLDVGTGVCVRTEALGGSIAGQGHELRIEAVDEPMGDELFVEPRRGLFRRR